MRVGSRTGAPKKTFSARPALGRAGGSSEPHDAPACVIVPSAAEEEMPPVTSAIRIAVNDLEAVFVADLWRAPGWITDAKGGGYLDAGSEGEVAGTCR